MKDDKEKDGLAGLGELIGTLGKALAKTKNHKRMGMGQNTMEFPMTVSKIKLTPRRGNPKAEFVAVRPCAKEHEGKTFLGYHLGDLPLEIMASWDPETEELCVFNHENPAIFVPDLGKIVYGCESWWGPIKDEAHLKQITDDDIDNVWYVKVLKQLHKEKPGE